MAILAALLQIIVGAMLVVPSLPAAGTMFAFYLSGTAYMVNPLIFGWANIILQRNGDDAARGVTLYCMNIGSMVLWTFWGILFYSGADAPYWKKGSIVLIVCSVVMLVYIFAVKKVSFDHIPDVELSMLIFGLKVDNYTYKKYCTDPTGEQGSSSDAGEEKQVNVDVAEKQDDAEERKL